LLVLTGCPQPVTRTNNQGGGSILTASLKIAGGQMSQLTPDEIQILADTLTSSRSELALPPLTDEQAQAVSDFLVAHNINTVDDIQRVIDEAESNPGSVVIPDSVRQLFEAGAFG